MEHIPDTQELVANYKQTNKLLRNRVIFLSIIFLLILGLFNTIQRNNFASRQLRSAINELLEIAESDSVRRAYTDAIDNLTFYFYYSAVDKYDLAQLTYDLQKTNYQDKTPIFQLIAKLRVKQDNLGEKSGDYQINLFGMNTSFSNWLYFSPFILMLLYHDMMLIFLYRKSLQKRIELAEISPLMLGPELFFQDHTNSSTLLNRFIQILTTSFIAILLILPLLPTVYGAIKYISESREDDIQPVLVCIQWASLIIMLIEAGIIFYSQDIFSSQKRFKYIFKQLTISTWNILFVEIGVTIIFTTLIGLLSYDFPWKLEFQNITPHISHINWLLVSLTFFSLIPMCLGTILQLKNTFGRVATIFRIVGRMMLLSWVIYLTDFFTKDYKHIYVYIPLDAWYSSISWLFPFFLVIASLYVWIRSKWR